MNDIISILLILFRLTCAQTHNKHIPTQANAVNIVNPNSFICRFYIHLFLSFLRKELLMKLGNVIVIHTNMTKCIISLNRVMPISLYTIIDSRTMKSRVVYIVNSARDVSSSLEDKKRMTSLSLTD